MSYNTYQQGLKLASDTAAKAIAAESSLPTLNHNVSPLPTLQKAFHHYVTSASSYSHLLSSNLVPQTEKPIITKKWRLVLERAEKVKKRIEELGGNVGKVGDEGEEDAVVRRGGNINGVITESWREPGSWEFKGRVFVDTQGVELNDEQKALDPVWSEAEALNWDRESGKEDIRWLVKQGPGHDCSVVAGLGVCMEHNRKWRTKLGQNALYPQASFGQPTRSENGKHVAKLLLNGAWRSIVIDALLPVSKKDKAPLYATAYPYPRPQLSSANSNPTSIFNPIPTLSNLTISNTSSPPWLPLLVKAYYKSQGGYSIRGSSPSHDLYSLTGWIPERLDLKAGFQREKEWTRIQKAWEDRKVLITLGTGEEIATGSQLVSKHAYGVYALRDDGERMLEIIDPGSDVGGMMEMSWDAVCSEFGSIHLNWDPDLLPLTAARHWSWPKPSPNDVSTAFDPRFQVSVTCPPSSTSEGGEIWFLLSQHTTSKDRRLEDVAIHIFEDHGSSSRMGGISSHAGAMNPYSNNLHTLVRCKPRKDISNLLVVAARDNGIYQTGFTLSAFAPQGCKIEMERISRSMPFSQSVKGSLTSRTAGGNPGLSTYPQNPQYRLSFPPASSSSTSSSQHAYSSNTGIKKNRGALRILLNGDKSLAWNIKLLWGKGELVFDLEEDLIRSDSGAYSFGMACIDIPEFEGGVRMYTLIVSAFEAGQIGDFTLSVESTLAFGVDAIPPEGAGMFSRVINGKWTESTSAGRPSLGQYHLNPRIDLILSQPTTLFARLTLIPAAPLPPSSSNKLPTPSITITTPNDEVITASPSIPAKVKAVEVSIPVNLTLFRRESGGGVGEMVLTSGPYSDKLSGVVLNESSSRSSGLGAGGRVRLDPGIYVGVVSCFESGHVGGWRVAWWGDKSFSAELVR